MRICILSYDYLPNPGGVASHVHFLTQALVGAGHDVSLLANYQRADHASPHGPPMPGLTNCAIWPAVAGRRYARVPDVLRRAKLIHRWHNSEPFDLVHYHSLHIDVATLRCAFGLRGAARVFTNHTSGFLQEAATTGRRPSLAKELAYASRIIAPSSELRDVTVSLGVPASRVTYIPNGVDSAVFAPGLSPRDGSIALATRRLVHKNGVDILVKAWPQVVAAVPEAELWLAGDGPERCMLEALAGELSVSSSIRFMGNVARQSLPALYRQATLAVLPSRREAVSISALEALSSGLPVVATRVGGLPEVVRPGQTGVLVEPEDSHFLAEGIIRVLEAPDRGAALGLRGRSMVVQNYTWPAIAARTLDLYNEALLNP